MRKKLTAIILSITILALIIPSSHASPELTLTIQTDKTRYNFGETITFNGTLTKYGTPVADALVAIQIVDSEGVTLIYRTLNTGTEPQRTWFVEILEVMPSDELGNPKTSFRRGRTAYFKVTVRNNLEESRYAFLVLNLFYILSHETPFKAILYYKGNIPPGTVHFIAPVEIPQDAPIGTAKVYANAYEQLPENVGHAYCPEKSAIFTITNSATSSSSQTLDQSQQTSEGSYSFTFNLPDSYIRVGNYTLYASTTYQLEHAFTYTTFEVILLGDINGDKVVDIFDAVLLARASGSIPGDPHWDPRCDLNKDSIVDLFDAVILAKNTGKIAL